MSGYKQWGGWGGGYKSTSGWENSHFGGFTRVLNDYPYIKIDFDLDIKASGEAARELGTWQAEKLIKLYILKAKELGVINTFTSKVIERPSFFGTTVKKYSVVSLNSRAILSKICASYPEMAPMFEHYKDSILSSTIEMEIPEPKPEEGKGKKEGEGEGEGQPQGEKEEGEGEGEGDGEGQGDSEDDGEDEKESESGSPGEGRETPKGRSGKSIQDLMGEINESKPWSVAERSLTAFSEKPKFTPFDKKDSGSSYQFHADEKRDSELLIKLLDISFDPKSDEVKNLKLGKLDTSKIAEVPAGNLSIYKQRVEEQDTKPFSVCILADMSGSMGHGQRIPAQRHIMNTLYLAMSQILPPDKLYIYGHTGDYTPEIYTFYSPYDTDYEKNIQFYNNVHWCQNYDGPVIEAIHKRVRETNDDRIIFISLSDGQPSGNSYGGTEDNEELKRILERARRDEFVTVGIGIQADHVTELYTYSKVVNDLKLLPKEVSSIINQVVRAEFQ
jgi:hypothetical protein